MWNVVESAKCKRGVENVKCKVWSKVSSWSLEWKVSSVECKVKRAKCKVCSGKCKAWSVTNFTLRSVKIDVFVRVFFYGPTAKSTVRARPPSIFHDMSPHATPATELAPCHISRSADNWILKKTRNTTRLKCCACHAKWHRRCPKCCACHEKCNASSENVAKVLRLPHKMTCDTSWHMLECHEVPRLQRKTTWQPVLKTFNRDEPWSKVLHFGNPIILAYGKAYAILTFSNVLLTSVL